MRSKKVRKLFVGMLVISIAIVFSGCGNNGKEKMAEGIKYVNQGEYSKAKEALDEVLKEDPDNKEAKVLEEIIKNFKTAEGEYSRGSYINAKKVLDKIPSDYSKYKIKEKVDKLKYSIGVKIEEAKRSEDKIQNINTTVK